MQAPSGTNASSITPSLAGAGIPANLSKPPITPYHWLVVLLAAGGWLFDCMGQRIFVLAREPALKELLGANASDDNVKIWGGVATFLLMIGWATGGILFGMLSDRWGRVKVMVVSLLGYTVFSGISGFSFGLFDFLLYRLLFGLGVGGMFGAATTLIAESVPAHFRTVALGTMQALSSCGNMLASAISLKIIPGQESFWGQFSGWKVLFFAGVAPAILAVPMLLFLKEPEVWRRAREQAAGPGGKPKRTGSMSQLFTSPRWRRSTLVGICLGISGMVGLWGIAFFSPELISTAFKNRPLLPSEILDSSRLAAELKAPANPAAAHIQSRLSSSVLMSLQDFNPNSVDPLRNELNRIIQNDSLYDPTAFASLKLKKATQNLIKVVSEKHLKSDVILLNRQLVEQTFPGIILELGSSIQKTRSRGTILQDVGSLCGMFAFTFLAAYFSRRTAFLAAFALCLGSVSFVFYSLKTESDTYWMLPLMGFATLAPFAGYSIYFPEIFPTRLRGTGVGFCYNTVRYLAAPFPFMLGWLATHMPFRTVAIAMSSIYIIGMIALLWAPETKGQPLPED